MRIATLTLIALIAASVACGKRKAYDLGEDLGEATIGGGGASRVQGTPIVTTSPGGGAMEPVEREVVVKSKRKELREQVVKKKRLKPRPTFNVVRVQKVVEAVSDTSWELAALPFYFSPAKTPRGIEPEGSTPPTDTQWPIVFEYDYPPNNFQFKEARLVIDTKRDKTDTEGIYVDGVFSGRPPAGQLVNVAARIPDAAYRIYNGADGTGENEHYITYALDHYRRDRVNSFDLLLKDLLEPSPLTAFDAVSDGKVQVVLGDDSPVYKAYLVIKGDTIASDALQCALSEPFTFKNHLVHQDGNTIGEPAFTGAVGAPHETWTTPAGHVATEFHFDNRLPDAKLENIGISSAILRLYRAKLGDGGCPMVVVNGIGVSDAACDRSAATDVVERWDDAAAASGAWSAFKASLTSLTAGATVDLDLLALFGEATTKELLRQGKLNVALAGRLVTKSARLNYSNLTEHSLAAASVRAFQQPVDGPELIVDGSYRIDDCQVPNDPGSPMTEAGFVEPEYVPEYEEYEVIETVEVEIEEEGVETIIVGGSGGGGSGGDDEVLNDGAGPVIASLQVQDVTSSSATIYWTTDEPATSQAFYGIGAPSTATPESPKLVTFHKLVLTGLTSYKFYHVQVVSKDRYGNASTSSVVVFNTLR